MRKKNPLRKRAAARRHTRAEGGPGPEKKPGAAQEGVQEKKKRTTLQKAILGVGIALGSLIVIAVAIVAVIYGRMASVGSFTFAEEEGDAIRAAITPAPTMTATSTSTPGITPPTQPETPRPAIEQDIVNDELEPDEGIEPGSEFDLLPLAELFPQTELSAAQRAVMQAQNANTKDYTNVLLIGVDRRGSGGGNADTVMIATLDKRNKRLKLTSILRDCYVPIPGVGEGRLNSSAAHGGVPLLTETINAMLQLSIQDYVLVDFRMFERIIDKMGGVTVRMSAAEISAANDVIAGLNKQRGVDYLWDGFIFANPGSVRLTGQQALGYARIRKIDSDFTRTNRQFNVLNAVYAKFRSKGLTEQTALIYDLLPMVETNLSPVQIADIALAALSMDVAGLQHERVPFEGHYKSGSVNRKSALVLDLPMNAWKAHAFLYLNAAEPEEAQLHSGGPSLPPRTPSPTLPPELAGGMQEGGMQEGVPPGAVEGEDGDKPSGYYPSGPALPD